MGQIRKLAQHSSHYGIGRICVMLCAFQGPPRIVRLHGRGTVLQDGEPGVCAVAGESTFSEFLHELPDPVPVIARVSCNPPPALKSATLCLKRQDVVVKSRGPASEPWHARRTPRMLPGS